MSRKRLRIFSQVQDQGGSSYAIQPSSFIDIGDAPCYSNTMETQMFFIKSLLVQNTIMLFSVGIVLCFLGRAFFKKNAKHVIVFLIWLCIAVWFFNSPFFGFSKVIVSRRGIEVNYGILSFRNTVLPLDTPWKIETSPTGILKTSKLYYIRIGDHQSMKVKGKKDVDLLNRIGDAVERTKKGRLS